MPKIAKVILLLSEKALAADWDRPEEDKAWLNLQRLENQEDSLETNK